MKPEVKTIWVEALKSGEYKQGRGSLHYTVGTDDLFCCLGVLCDLAVKAGIIPAPTVDKSALSDVTYYYDGNGFTLPEPVQDWAEIDANGRLPKESEYPANNNYLSKQNDGGVSFERIAGMIEDQL